MKNHINMLRRGWKLGFVYLLTGIGALAVSKGDGPSSSPSVIVTYEGSFVDIPAIGVERDRVYFKFPTASHPERIRGADASCSTEGDITVWSFTRPSEMNPDFKQIGREHV